MLVHTKSEFCKKWRWSPPGLRQRAIPPWNPHACSWQTCKEFYFCCHLYFTSAFTAKHNTGNPLLAPHMPARSLLLSITRTHSLSARALPSVFSLWSGWRRPLSAFQGCHTFGFGGGVQSAASSAVHSSCKGSHERSFIFSGFMHSLWSELDRKVWEGEREGKTCNKGPRAGIEPGSLR